MGWAGVGELVRRMQARAYFGDEMGSEPAIERFTAQPQPPHEPAQALAMDVLHDDRIVSADRGELVDLDDPRVTDARRDLRFAEEHLDDRSIAGKMRQDPFHSHRVLERSGASATSEEHLRHATGSQPTQDLVAATGQ